jgi:hypothetical protein
MRSSVLFLCFATQYLQAQNLEIVRIDLTSEKVVVTYDLDDANPNNNYKVSLYSSKDNFSAPLIKVSGDIGEDVKPGENKKIEWSVGLELGKYTGEISVEVRAGVFIPFLRLTSFDTEKKYKRGKTYPLLWTSGNMGGQIDIDLYEGQNRVESDRGIPNTGKYEFSIPGSVKPGKYTLRFTNVRSRDEFITTPVFTVVPRLSTGIKVGGLVLFGGSIYLLTQFVNPPPPPPTFEDIEIHPVLPNN